MLKRFLKAGVGSHAMLGIAVGAGLAATAHASVISNSNNFPPKGAVYQTAPGTQVNFPGANFTISHLQFTPTDNGKVLPANGDSEETFWPSSGSWDYSLNGAIGHAGIPSILADLTLSTTSSTSTSNFKLVAVKTISWSHDDESPKETRLSPSNASTGEFDVTSLSNGSYQIDSYLNLYLQVSLDNGATWADASAPLRLDITSVPEPASGGLLLVAAGATLRRRKNTTR